MHCFSNFYTYSLFIRKFVPIFGTCIAQFIMRECECVLCVSFEVCVCLCVWVCGSGESVYVFSWYLWGEIWNEWNFCCQIARCGPTDIQRARELVIQPDQTKPDRQRERQTKTDLTDNDRLDRQAKTDRQRQTDRQTDRQTGRQTKTDRQAKTDRQTDRQAKTDRQRQTDRQRNRPARRTRQTDRNGREPTGQKDRQTDRQTDRERKEHERISYAFSFDVWGSHVEVTVVVGGPFHRTFWLVEVVEVALLGGGSQLHTLPSWTPRTFEMTTCFLFVFFNDIHTRYFCF